MKPGLFTTIVALAVAGALAAPASPATPSNRKLAAQVKVLQRQVKVLQGQVRTLRRQMRDVQGVSAAALAFSACSTAATADAFQGTWETIDRHAAVAVTPGTPHGPDQYPAQTPIVDPLNSCQLLEIQRQPSAVPPTTNVFAALLNLFR